MRILGAVLVFALGLQSAADHGRLVVVIDGDAAAAAPDEAARLRIALLEQVDPDAVATYYELTGAGIRQVASAEAASFRRTVFTVTPPSYSGVSVTFAESVEVLRGNEAVRGGLIGRGCGSNDCPGLVRAAVTEEVRRQEAESALKLKSIVAHAAEWRGARVVLFTAGWPTRDDGRVGLSRALRELRARQMSLAVVRVPPVQPYRGLVRDASESLAAQLPAGFGVLAGEDDVPIVAARVGLPSAVPTATTDSAGPAPSPPAAAEPASAPVAESALTPVTEEPSTLPATSMVSDVTLRRAAAYVARFERTFTEVIWHERYEQEVRVWRRFSSSGEIRMSLEGHRTMESEFYFAWLPKDGTWVAVRDVMTLDGKARPTGERRLAALAARGSVSVLELRELARENGRFNIGTIVRTFNEPTLALLFLSDRHRARVAWSRKGQRRVDGRVVATYAFTEQGRPTVIRSGDRDMPVRGTFDLDTATGEVLASTIELAEPLAAGEAFPRLTGRMAVDYRPHVAFDVLVPGEMRESYAAHRSEEVTATAIYSDFRRFGTTARLIAP